MFRGEGAGILAGWTLVGREMMVMIMMMVVVQSEERDLIDIVRGIG